jgi:hypothetical protein
MTKEEETLEIIDAEIVEELNEPKLDFDKPASRKQPRGTRKKDFPQFTPENREAIVSALTLGAPIELAAEFAGVHPDTVKDWLERGREFKLKLEEGEDLYPVQEDFAEFYDASTKKSANAAIAILGNLQRMARNNGNLALKLLEKIRPDEFGQRQTIDMRGKVAHGHVHVSGDRVLEGGETAKKLSEGSLWKIKELMKKEQKALEAGEKQDEDTKKDD